MILGIGVDIVKIARFEGKDKSNDNQPARIFTPSEQEYISKKGPQTAAGIFAAKEAIAKSLGTGFSGFWPNAIEITHNKKGRPQATLHQEAAKIAQNLANGEYSIMLSISHTNEDAVAFAVVQYHASCKSPT